MTGKIVNFDPDSQLKVARDRVITLKYALLDQDTGVHLEFREDLVYLHGGYEKRLLDLQAAVENLQPGMKTEVVIPCERAFGKVDPHLRFEVDAEELPPQSRKIWSKIEGETSDGIKVEFTVVATSSNRITVDGNHPYAGKNLKFVVEVVAVRKATEKELELGVALKQES